MSQDNRIQVFIFWLRVIRFFQWKVLIYPVKIRDYIGVKYGVDGKPKAIFENARVIVEIDVSNKSIRVYLQDAEIWVNHPDQLP